MPLNLESQKPDAAINLLIEKLSDPARIVTINKGGLISLNNGPVQDCFLIHQGIAMARRSDNNLIVGNLDAPLLFGFNKFLGIGGQIHVEAVTDIAFEVVPSTTFYDIIRQQQLWEQLLDVMMYLSSLLFHKHAILTLRDSRTIICHQLKELMNEPYVVRHTTSVHDYIQQRTHLSRSGIMKHLSSLRKKELIEMDNGILLSITPMITAADK